MTKNPFDISELFKSLNPEAMSKMFDPNNLMTAFKDMGKDLPDMSSVISTNKQQFEAMAEANKAAATSYKDMVEKQMEIFQDVTKPVQEIMADATDPAKVQAASAAMGKAVEDALGIMQEMAQSTQAANEKAFAEAKSKVSAALKASTKS